MKFEDLIGATPLLKLESIPALEGIAPDVALFAKLEGSGPGGSVKDRPAWNMIRGALERGDIAPGGGLVEATSGNTGIALAMAAGRLGLRMTLIVPEQATVERVHAMAAYGARVVRADGIEEARLQAEAMAATGSHHMLDQFSNPDNWRMHYRTTGPEVWRDTGGRVTHFVSSMGTTGTIMGTSRYLKERDPSIRIVGLQPAEGSRIPGIRRWSPGMVPAIYEPERVDRIVEVSAEQARSMTRRLAREEGILAGMSSGGALHAALTVARELDAGVVVFIVCDRGDRYLSSGLFS
ncbi:MAG: cysteine synthase CysM [Gemmatimonadota bacterium]